MYEKTHTQIVSEIGFVRSAHTPGSPEEPLGHELISMRIFPVIYSEGREKKETKMHA